MKQFEAKVFDKVKYRLGEGPVFDPRNKVLSWVDISGGLFCYSKIEEDKLTYIKSVSFGQMVGAAIPAEETGKYIVAATDGLYILDTETNKYDLYYETNKIYEPYQRSNDAKADPEGRLYFGSIVYDGKSEEKGNLFVIDKVKEVKIAQKDTKLSNGMAWSKDKKKFYFSDSLEHAVFVYDYDYKTGEITNRKVLFKISSGIPDGMCIDSDDNLWLSIWGGRRVEKRCSKTGQKLAEIKVDAENVTCCTFMGETNKLIITTSGDGKEGEFDGCIFICETDSIGVNPSFFVK